LSKIAHNCSKFKIQKSILGNLSMKFLHTIILALLLLSAPGIADAHVTGNSFEQVNGAYRVDVGYDLSPFVAGEAVRFDFNVVQEQTLEDVDFGDVWVRVSQGNRTVFASGIHKPVLGKTGMTFTFPDAGDYDLSVRFQKNGSSIVETTFPVSAQENAAAQAEAARQDRQALYARIAWGVAALGWIIAIILIVYRAKKAS
jgi:hypothetical protein